MNQSVGNVHLFIRIFKERLNDTFIRVYTWKLVRISLSRLRMASHRLKVKTGWWQKPTALTFNDRKCTLCLKLEDAFPIRMSFVSRFKKEIC